jgi:hypothetical protein
MRVYRGCCGCARIVVGFTTTYMPITTKVVNLNPAYGEVYSIQHYVISFVSDLGQVNGFLQGTPVSSTATIKLKYC